MRLEDARNYAVSHYTQLATTKGWYAYIRAEVHRLNADQSGLFTGLRALVATNLKGFEVPQDERGEWWK